MNANNPILIAAAKEQLTGFGAFIDAYDKTLQMELNQWKIYKDSTYYPIEFKALIKIDYNSEYEQITVPHILESDQLLNKLLLTFGYLCEEIAHVSKEAHQMQIKFLFLDDELLVLSGMKHNNHDKSKQINNDDNSRHVMLKMSESMKLVYEIHFLLERCVFLSNNLLHQCSALFSIARNFNSVLIQLTYICDYLSELFAIILTFDEIMERSNFGRYWPLYKKTVNTLLQSELYSKQFTVIEMNSLPHCLGGLGDVISGFAFRHLLQKTFVVKKQVASSAITQLTHEFNNYVKGQISKINKLNTNELHILTQTKLLVQLNAFCVVFREFCGQVNSKSLKQLLQINNKHHTIMLISNVFWLPFNFLQRNAPSLLKVSDKVYPSSKKQQQQQLHLYNQTLAQLTRQHRAFCAQILFWMIQVDAIIVCNALELQSEQLKQITELLIQGIHIADKLYVIIKSAINSHEVLQMPMSKLTVFSVGKLMELLTTIQVYYQKHAHHIARVIQCILQYNQWEILNVLNNCKNTIHSIDSMYIDYLQKNLVTYRLEQRNLDALVTLKIVVLCLHASPSKCRLRVSKLAFSACNYLLTTKQQQQFYQLTNRLELMAGVQQYLDAICDTTFFYWHQNISVAYLKQIMDKQHSFFSIPYFLNSANKCYETLHNLDLKNFNITIALKTSNSTNMRSDIVSKLCAHIETYLRFEAHTNLQILETNPFQNGLKDYRDLLKLNPIEINGNYVILRSQIENYLGAMFYNLTAISLHDWKTYLEMRHIANNRLHLYPVYNLLPDQNLEQRMDILEIMRKIQVFVEQYAYNMHSQIFVEGQCANKHLNTIGIRHMANSLCTHGTGVINTTVNFIYQFLRQKFYTFSQFLYDEQIKARLMKESRSLAEHKNLNQNPIYPYERANLFNKDIEKLGVISNGQSYMDQFRKLITYIGNALGYIRLVRSGSLHANYNYRLYLPKFDEKQNLLRQSQELDLCSITQNSAKNVEINIQNLSNSFSKNTNFLKILIDVFQPFFRNPNNLHLRNFYLIVPPLIMNYIEYISAAKAGLSKKDCYKAVMFDDGFALGLTYILKLLNQIDDFNSLHWFNTVKEHFEEEICKIHKVLIEVNQVKSKKKSSNANIDKSENEKLQQTLLLTEQRITTYQMEYNFLYYNLFSAKIFFH